MTAYSFQPQFEAPTIARTKVQTLRAVGKRHHAKPGGALQHYQGMRSQHCRLWGTSTCQWVSPITLDFAHNQIIYPLADAIVEPERLDVFAVYDGFAHWKAMMAFWEKHHSEEYAAGRWEGLRIFWGDTFKGAEP